MINFTRPYHIQISLRHIYFLENLQMKNYMKNLSSRYRRISLWTEIGFWCKTAAKNNTRTIKRAKKALVCTCDIYVVYFQVIYINRFIHICKESLRFSVTLVGSYFHVPSLQWLHYTVHFFKTSTETRDRTGERGGGEGGKWR